MGRAREAGMPHANLPHRAAGGKAEGVSPRERLAASMGIVCLTGAKKRGGKVG